MVREQATRGLWETEDRAIIRPLIDLLHHDPSPKVRSAASISLGKFAVMAQNGKLISRDEDRIREALIAVIGGSEEDVEVKRRAIEAVACFDYPGVDEIIREAYQSREQKLVQSSIYAMGQRSNPEWLPTVVTEMEHEDPAIRYEATIAGGKLGDESIATQLIRLLQDEDAQVQLAAVRALGYIGGPLAKRALQQCVKMEDEALETAAQDALNSFEFDEDPLALRFEV